MHLFPLTRLGKHVIDQVRGGLHHPPGAARRRESTPLAAERHQVLMAAASALDP